MKIIECVPNFSEGCDQKKIDAIAKVFESFPGVRLVDFSGDTDHNRSVYTFLGKADDVLFIPLSTTKMKDAVDIAHRFGQQLYELFGVPVYFYGAAALVPERNE